MNGYGNAKSIASIYDLIANDILDESNNYIKKNTVSDCL